MKEKYIWLVAGVIVGTLFGSRIPVLNKISA
jgi:hypothetical protein